MRVNANINSIAIVSLCNGKGAYSTPTDINFTGVKHSSKDTAKDGA
jgi:hypothetical protein